ncbi:Autoexporter, AT family porin [Cupriavidus necator]
MPPGAATPVQDKPRSGWLRAVGKWEGSRSKDGNFRTRTDSFLLHGGAELARWRVASETDRLHVGVMGSYGNASTDADAAGNPARARGKVEGWAAGVYGTWYQNDENKLGAYVDTWFQYGWFTKRVEGDQLPTVRYHAQGLGLSGEVGYAIPLPRDWVIEPQAQLIYVNYSEDDIAEPNGTRVSGADSSGIIARLGVRTHRTFVREDGRKLQPYATVNWWYSDTDTNISFNQLPIGGLYPHNRFELKLGLNADLGKRWTGWTNVSGSWGQQSFYQYALRAGVKYTW